MGSQQRRPYLARIERSVVEGEVVEVRLVLLRDEGTVHLSEGDEFATVLLAIDPWGRP